MPILVKDTVNHVKMEKIVATSELQNHHSPAQPELMLDLLTSCACLVLVGINAQVVLNQPSVMEVNTLMKGRLHVQLVKLSTTPSQELPIVLQFRQASKSTEIMMTLNYAPQKLIVGGVRRLVKYAKMAIFVLKRQVTRLHGSGVVQEVPTVPLELKLNVLRAKLESESVLEQKLKVA